jgi:glycosyltransferase involved in cell wall biosynthesis
VNQLLDSFRPDAVLSYWVHPDGAVAVRVARRLGVPSVIQVGGSDVLLLPEQPGRKRGVVHALREASAVAAVSHNLRAKLLELGVPQGRALVIQQGLKTSRFHPGPKDEARARLGIPAGERVLLWVGRMVPVKALGMLLLACARLRDGGTAARLYLVGDGPLLGALEGKCRGLRLSDRVSFVGSRPPDRLPDWYRAADLTVLPSLSEGLPNVLRESLACGTPFVASDVGGIRELGAGPPSRLVPPGDVDALTDALARALADVGASVPAAARFDDWNDTAETFARLFESLRAGAAGVGREYPAARPLPVNAP